MPTLAELPSLTRRMESAVAAVLGDVEGLGGINIREGATDGEIETPFIVVNANRAKERIHGSGVYEIDVRIQLKTTVGVGPKCTDDAQLLAYDIAIEEALWAPGSLAAELTAAAEFIRCDAVLSPSSEPTSFDATRREIAYFFTAVCLSLPEIIPPPPAP